ncbi:MAG: hypothetical protein QOI95_3269 [Acidimicrobiaceae bacterium]
MTDAAAGDGPRLRLLAFSGPGLDRVLLGEPRDGEHENLETLIAAHAGGAGRADVSIVPTPSSDRLAAELARYDDLGDVDVVVLWIGSALTEADEIGPDLGDRFFEHVTAAVEVVKSAGSRVLLVTGSTVVTGVEPSAARALSLAIARLDLASIRLSIAHGLSLIDVDRTIAELGADAHVEGVLAYSAVASRAIRHELLRVLDEYGFFDDRSLLEQVGQAAR